MRAVKGGTTYEAGRYPITIIPGSATEADELRRLGTLAAHRLLARPNVYQPYLGDNLVLSFKEDVNPAEVLRQFKDALRACKNED